MPNFFANVGLVSEGMNDAAYQRDSRAANLTNQNQQQQLRNQQIQEGQFGLDDMNRTRSVDASVRNAAKGVTGQGQSATFDAMAAAAEAAGDPMKAIQLRKVKRTLEDEGFKDIIHEALTNPKAGKRPDLEQVFNSIGKHRVAPGSVELSDTGDLTFIDANDGKPNVINIGKTATALGLIKPFEKEIPAGGRYIRGDAASGKITTDITNTPREAKKGFEMGKVTNNGTEYAVSFDKDTGVASLINPDGTPVPGKVDVKTDSMGNITAVVKDGNIFTVTPGAPATAGEKNWFSSDVPPTPATSPRLNQVLEPTQPPVPGAQQSPDGKWWIKQGDKWAPVTVNGASSAAPAKAAPVATDAAVAEAPKPKPKASGASGSKPQVEKAKTGGREFDEDLEKKNPKLGMLGKSVRLGSSDPNVDVSLWLQYVNLAKQLGSKKYAKGGKIQRYGLNA